MYREKKRLASQVTQTQIIKSKTLDIGNTDGQTRQMFSRARKYSDQNQADMVEIQTKSIDKNLLIDTNEETVDELKNRFKNFLPAKYS